MALKILVLVKTFNPYTETFIYNDVTAMSASHQVQVVAMERINESIRPFDHFTLIPDYTPPFILQKFRGLKRRLNLGLDYRFPPIQLALENILRTFQPDIIHCHFGHLALYFLDNMQAKCPVFLNFHGNDATRKIHTSTSYRMRIKVLMQNQQIYPLGTSASLFEFMKSYGISSPRTQVIYSGVNPAFFKKEKASANKQKTLLQVGGFRPKKAISIPSKLSAYCYKNIQICT
jgi:colanic acid/amylovoran biosynthesis glycosyltransferase